MRSWTKSSRCDTGSCVEVARRGQVLVRDSTQPRVELAFDRTDWQELLDGVRAGRLERS